MQGQNEKSQIFYFFCLYQPASFDLPKICCNKTGTAAPGGGSGIQHPKVVLFLVYSHVGVSEENGIHFGGTGIRQQAEQGLLNTVAMTVCDQQANASQFQQPGFRIGDPASVQITVARHLVKGNVGKFFLNILAVMVVITQMDHCVRLDRFHTVTHKA